MYSKMKKKVYVTLVLSKELEVDVPEKHTDIDLRIAVLKQHELPGEGSGWDRNEFEVIE